MLFFQLKQYTLK